MIVVKYGGNAMGATPDEFLADCAQIIHAGQKLILVHGGGPQIDAALKVRGIPEQRIAGLRVTDEATLDITESVLVASVNKRLVRTLFQKGIRAVGISGQDAGLLVARRLAPIEGVSLGYVGEITSVAPQLLLLLLEHGFTPVVAPIGIAADAREHYNLNADTAAGAIAGAVRAAPYLVITDVPRVRRDPKDPASGIDQMTLSEARALLNGGSFDGGMRPKMLAVFEALEQGADHAIIAGGDHALHKALKHDATIITKD